MDNKFYVSLEAARLLKEKGYNEKCISYYQDNCREIYHSFCGERNSNWEERCVSAPSKAEAIDWLDSKGMCIVVIRRTIDNEVGWRYVIYSQTEIISGFSTRLEAEDAAIIKACELLTNEN